MAFYDVETLEIAQVQVPVGKKKGIHQKGIACFGEVSEWSALFQACF